jgi:hypothetical protein
MSPELHGDTIFFLLGNIVALANIIERVKFHHQMVHAVARPLGNGEAVMASVDVHEIQRDRRPHEVSDLETQQVPIECKSRVNVGHDEHSMPNALRASTETAYVPPWAEWFIGDLTTVESLHTVAGWIAEGNHCSGATLVRHSGSFPPYRNAGIFQPPRQPIERARVRNLPAEKPLSIHQPTVKDQALFPVVHAEGTYSAAAINCLKPKLPVSQSSPVIEL